MLRLEVRDTNLIAIKRCWTWTT